MPTLPRLAKIGGQLVDLASLGSPPEIDTSQSLLAADGVWCWFADPRAFRHVGTQDRVYGGMMRFNSATPADIAVFQLDLPTGAVTEFTLSTGFERDDHDNPPLVMWPDGKIQAFWSPHGAGPMRHRMTTNAESIAAWDAVQSIPTAVNSATGTSGYTYPNPVILSGEGTPGTGRLYLFWRGADFYPTFAYSDDRGATWTGPSGSNNSAYSLIAGGSNRNYVKVVSNGTDRIDLFMTSGHPDSVNADLYHCYIQGGAIKKTDGTTIRASFAALAASPMAITELTKIYDHTTDGRGWVWDIAYDATGKPVVTFAAMPTPDVAHRYYRAHWTGSAWVNRRIGTVTSSTLYELPNPNLISAAVEPYYSGGVMLDHDNPDIVYLAHDTSGVFEMARADTSDAGVSWTITPLTSGHSYPRKQFRPITVHNHGDDCPVAIWSDGIYGTFADGLAAVLKCSPAIPGVTQPAEPVFTVAPAITGTVSVGSTLTCGTGTCTGTPTIFRRQWMRNDRAIPGNKVASTYQLTADDVGQQISCLVMAINGGGMQIAESNTVAP